MPTYSVVYAGNIHSRENNNIDDRELTKRGKSIILRNFHRIMQQVLLIYQKRAEMIITTR